MNDLTRDIFRFVAIRPPQKASAPEKSIHFFDRKRPLITHKPDYTHVTNMPSIDNEFQDIIYNLGSEASWNRIKQAARQFIKDKMPVLDDQYFNNMIEKLWLFFKRQGKEFKKDDFIYGITCILKSQEEKPKYYRILKQAIDFLRMIVLLILKKWKGPLKLNTTEYQPISDFLKLIDTPDETTGKTYRNILWNTLYAFSIDSTYVPSLRERIIMLLRVINILESVETIKSAQELVYLMNASPLLPEELFKNAPKADYAPVHLYSFKENEMGELNNKAYVRPLGFGDLKVVRQTLEKYQMDEIAHVENVMKGEYKERKHRRLDRAEETLFVSVEKIDEAEKDLQSTERFELQKEIDKTIEEDLKFESGVSVSASYGPTVKVNADTNFAMNNSKIESDRQSTDYAKEIVSRSVSRISDRIREERTKTILQEIEETNTHGFDNKKGSGHVVGIYRWLDKIYRAQVVNYGKRLMYEFIIPEPAAFYIYSQNKPANVSVREPYPFTVNGSVGGRELKPGDINENNYKDWISKYNVTTLKPPPEEYIERSIVCAYKSKDSKEEIVLAADRGVNISQKITIPEGYQAVSFSVRGPAAPKDVAEYEAGGYPYWSVWVGKTGINSRSSFNANLHDELGPELPVILYAGPNCWFVYLTITVKCKRTKKAFEDWQLKTYYAIFEAYCKMKADYDKAVEASTTDIMETIKGKNPDINRQIEKQELKKSCLCLLRDENFRFNSIKSDSPGEGEETRYYPEIDKDALSGQCGDIQFFEQAFEWEQMTYLFYPYFWGRRERWVDSINMDDTDPLFTKFLQAGAARVIVPVRPSYEFAVLYYLKTKGLWGGGDAPTIDNEMFVSIVAELKSQAGAIDEEMLTGEEWDVKVSTSLVMLQENSKLPDYSSG